MSELRRDPFTGRWVVIAEGRSARPNEHAGRPPRAETDPNCPFCEGHEDRTPPETVALRPGGGAPNTPGWTIRAIPNKFPTFGGSGPAGGGSSRGLDFRPGRGVHEVVIESPSHAPAMPALSPERLGVLFRFLRDRVRAIEQVPDVQSVLLFENWGPESGGTLWHPHAQIVGVPQVPARLEEEQRRFGEGGPCLLEEVTASERRHGSRVIVDEPVLTLSTPYGSAHPYEMRLVPRQHRASFGAATDEEVAALAELLPASLRALEAVQPGLSYNWFVHGGGRATPATFHWHVEVVPRLVRPDGFELGSELPVNPVPPESAAVAIGAALVPDRRRNSRKR